MSERSEAILDLIHSRVNSGNSSFNRDLLRDLFTLLDGYEVGWVDYSNSDTSPVTALANTWTKLPNDLLGAQTNDDNLTLGVPYVMDNTGSLQLRYLNVGSLIFWRYDLQVTTGGNNTSVEVRSSWGDAGPFSITAANPMQIKNAGTFDLAGFTGGYIGSDDVRLNPVDMQIRCDLQSTFINRGSFMLILAK